MEQTLEGLGAFVRTPHPPFIYVFNPYNANKKISPIFFVCRDHERYELDEACIE
jgi:hypothetical protein